MCNSTFSYFERKEKNAEKAEQSPHTSNGRTIKIKRNFKRTLHSVKVYVDQENYLRSVRFF